MSVSYSEWLQLLVAYYYIPYTYCLTCQSLIQNGCSCWQHIIIYPIRTVSHVSLLFRTAVVVGSILLYTLYVLSHMSVSYSERLQLLVAYYYIPYTYCLTCQSLIQNGCSCWQHIIIYPIRTVSHVSLLFRTAVVVGSILLYTLYVLSNMSVSYSERLQLLVAYYYIPYTYCLTCQSLIQNGCSCWQHIIIYPIRSVSHVSLLFRTAVVVGSILLYTLYVLSNMSVSYSERLQLLVAYYYIPYTYCLTCQSLIQNGCSCWQHIIIYPIRTV